MGANDLINIIDLLRDTLVVPKPKMGLPCQYKGDYTRSWYCSSCYYKAYAEESTKGSYEASVYNETFRTCTKCSVWLIYHLDQLSISDLHLELESSLTSHEPIRSYRIHRLLLVIRYHLVDIVESLYDFTNLGGFIFLIRIIAKDLQPDSPWEVIL